MPIYEYQCKACGSTSEYLIGVGNNEDVCCKTCGSNEVKRVLSVASYMGGMSKRAAGRTCCGREERCETPPCSDTGGCRRG
ncbi:MAG: zinc ribbon domain-containing protein [Desulfatiglans sp.]|nr:zinc ribbon domain-containing protein [Thermodesulfobacteriota bacterium]MEE4352804.1 zinc ribbon domain-containing protein [Desulfatiglans sp.]